MEFKTEKSNDIIQNGLIYYGDDIEVIVSTHRHDYRCSSDNKVCVDGGNDYLRRIVGKKVECFDISLYENDNIKRKYKLAAWGHKSKSGKDPLTFNLIYDLEESHLEELIGYISERDPDNWKLEVIKLVLELKYNYFAL